MKKNVFYCLFAASCAVTALSSCSEDYEPTPNLIQAIEKDVAGDYKGTLSVEVDGISFEPTNQNIVIERSGMNRVDLTISNFSFANMPLGDVTLADCILEKKGDTYTFQRTEELTLADPVGTCPVSSAATIAKEKVEVTLDITVPALNNQKVNVVYEGTRLTGSENTEAKILSFTFDPSVEANAVVISEPVIDEAAKTISFRTLDGADISALVPTITVSEGAMLTPASDEAVDFASPVTYTVISEDGKTSVVYTVKNQSSALMKYSFEDWGIMNGTSSFPDTKSATWDSPLPLNELASANEGVAALKTSIGGGYTGDYAMTKDEDGYKGSAVKLQTLYTNALNEIFSGSIPAITPASLYTGTFEFSMKITAAEQLTMTKFGLPYDKKPVSFKGAYKYAKGDNYIDGSTEDPGLEHQEGEDRGLIMAVLFEVTPELQTLDGTNLKTAPNRVMIAQVGGEAGVADAAEWTEFEVPFELVEGAAEYSADKEYKLAIVCQSSVDGSNFKGAAGSTLWVDEIEVIGE